MKHFPFVCILTAILLSVPFSLFGAEDEDCVDCAKPKSKQLTPNLGLLQSFSDELSDKLIPCKGEPYYAKFKKNGKELVFMAANHSYGPEEKNSTFQAIRRVFDKFKPELALVESLPYSKGNNPAAQTASLEKCEADNFKHCPEIHFTAHMAVQHKVPFRGSEPSTTELLQFLDDDYSVKDYACFQWMGVLTFNKESFLDGAPNAEKNREAFADSLKKSLGVRYTYKDFLHCYQSAMKKKPNIAKFNTQDFRPDKSKKATFFQKFMYDQDRLRNKTMVQSIAKSMNANKKVFIVLGSGHLVEQMAALKNMLGAPTFECKP